MTNNGCQMDVINEIAELKTGETVWLAFNLQESIAAAQKRFSERCGIKPNVTERDHNYLWVGYRKEKDAGVLTVAG